MSSSRLRFAIWSLLIVASLPIPFLGAQPGSNPQAGPRVDRNGDALPDHALLRIGTTRLRSNVTARGVIRATAFTRDGKSLVIINGGVQVWDLGSGKKIRDVGKPASYYGFALSADGSRAALVESKEICNIYDTANGKLISSLTGDWYEIREPRFSPDNKYLGSSHLGAMAVWDVATGTKLWDVQFPEAKSFGTFVFVSSDKMAMRTPHADSKLLLYDLAKGPASAQEFPIEPTEFRGLMFSPDGKLMAFQKESNVILRDVATGKVLQELKSQAAWMSCASFSQDSNWILTVTSNGRVQLWDTHSGELYRQFTGYDNGYLSLATSPDKKYIATTSEDGTFWIWDIESGRAVFEQEGHRMRNVQARFSDDGKAIVSICGFNPTAIRSLDERTFYFWDVDTGALLRRITLDRKEFLPFCLSGDAKILFVIDKGKITKKNLISGTSEDITGLPADYYTYRCSANGRYLSAQTNDFWGGNENDLVKSNFLKVLDTLTGKEVLAYEGRKGEQFDVRFTQEGPYLAVHSFCYETDGKFGRRSGMDLKESVTVHH